MDARVELEISTTHGEKNFITRALAGVLKSFFGHEWRSHEWPKKLFKTTAKAQVMKFFSPQVVDISNSSQASIMKRHSILVQTCLQNFSFIREQSWVNTEKRLLLISLHTQMDFSFDWTN